MMLRSHKVVECTSLVGPGKRFCLWVQGCKRHCEGCMATETWDMNGGYPINTEDVIRNVLETDDIEGITFLGGEPFEQAEALSIIGKAVRKEGLSVVTFTGYTIEEIVDTRNEGFRELLAVTDLLIDGAFRIELKSLDRPWIGSSNQRHIFMTERYSLKNIKTVKNKLEVRIYPDGRTMVSGMGEFTKIYEYMI